MLSACAGLAFSPMKDLTLSEKVGQVLMPHFHGEVANEEAKTLICELGVGGIIYYSWANGLTSPRQVQALSQGLQSLAKDRLLLAIDQEGGVVARLTNGFTIFPGNKALEMTGEPELAKRSACAMGEELRAVGINMNLAPVVDTNSNPRNPVIGIRAFSDSAEKVVLFANQALLGYKSAGILTTLKHFPGHGDVTVDSHEDLPVVCKAEEALYREELLPFIRCAPLADAVMTAHILIPALDKDVPATISKKTLSIIRKNFDGPIISDSIIMQGLVKKCGSVDEAAVQALNAGCDIILLGGSLLQGKTNFELTISDVRRIHKHIMDAVNEGKISRERLDDAVKRVLLLKAKIPALLGAPVGASVSTQEHQALAKEIATKALRVTGTPPLLHQKHVAIIAPEVLHAALNTIPKPTDLHFFKELNPSPEDVKAMVECAQKADVCVFCSYNAWKNPAQEVLGNSLLDTKKPVIVIVSRDPLDTSLFERAESIVTTYSPTAPSLRAAMERLTNTQERQ